MKKIKFKYLAYAAGALVVIAISFLNLSASGTIALKGKSGVQLADLSLNTQSAAACQDEDLLKGMENESCTQTCHQQHKVLLYYVDGVPVFSYTYTTSTATGHKWSCNWMLTSSWCTDEQNTPCDAECDTSGDGGGEE
jgi:hypothetical protein